MLCIEFQLELEENETNMSRVANVAKDMKKYFSNNKITVKDVLVHSRPAVRLLQVTGTE